MKIAYICPTRAKPTFFEEFVYETLENCRLAETVFVVGYDDDEEDLYSRFFPHPRFVRSVAPREDSLGAKFNRVAAAIDADVYVMGVDDLAIQLPGWDYTVCELAKLFTDGIGVVTLGEQWMEPALPAFQCVTKRFIELNGFFMAPFFPYWWHDTWNIEMSELVGRRLHFPAQIKYPQSAPPYLRKDLTFWAKFFDETRGLRCEAADRIIAASDDAPWRKWELLAKRDLICDYGQQRNALLRDPQYAKRHEGGDLNDQHMDRHDRLKANALAMLAMLEKRDAA